MSLTYQVLSASKIWYTADIELVIKLTSEILSTRNIVNEVDKVKGN
jgi:hypothetical protein